MESFQRLLYMGELPPSTLAGAPLIVKRLLESYDPSSLFVLCCEHQYASQSPLVKGSYLPCDHTVVKNLEVGYLRPRRVFGPLWETANVLRIPRILSVARRLVATHEIEGILTVPWRCDFALAAYALSKRSGLPLYVFETDDWEAMNPHLLHGYLVRRYHRRMLEHAEKLWLISPAMVRRYEQRFDVSGEFLFHYVDADRYSEAASRRRPFDDPGTISLVYTGSINQMFYETMKELTRAINNGMEVDGREVRLAIYGGSCPPELLGPRVTWKGFVHSDEIPDVLADADVLLIAVTFSQDRKLVDLVKTSIYTKTVDYLAANRPVLIVSPPYSAQVDYFGSVAKVIAGADEQTVRDALRSMLEDPMATERRSQRGTQLVRDQHSLDTLSSVFLDTFRRAAGALE